MKIGNNILVKNCSANSLKDVCVELQLGRLTALAGPSGSGKSSFAYNELYKMETCKIINRPEKVIYISQKTASTSEKWKKYINETKSLRDSSLVIVDELCTGMTANEAKIATEHLVKLARKGNTVVAIEHRLEPLSGADRVLLFGPGAGINGGDIVADISGKEYAVTSHETKIVRKPNVSGKKLTAKWKDFRGIKDYEIEFPIGKVAVVAGPMSSGKSTFIDAAFAVCDKSAGAGERRGQIESIKGKENLRRPHIIDATPISKNPRSNVGTYYGLSKFLKPGYKGLTIDELSQRSADRLLLRRIKHLQSVGLGYLNISQPSFTLSGGECQRLKLAKMMCKKLGDRSLYIFDNPMRGLDRRNALNLIRMFDMLVKKNNSLLIAENDPIALKYADQVILMQPLRT